MSDTPRPQDVHADTQRRELVLTWDDGQVQRLPFFFLRCWCRCARCEDEMTGARLLDPATIPEDIVVRDMQLVGNYAVRITWSDGHDTGLYTWKRLRSMDPEDPRAVPEHGSRVPRQEEP